MGILFVNNMLLTIAGFVFGMYQKLRTFDVNPLLRVILNGTLSCLLVQRNVGETGTHMY